MGDDDQYVGNESPFQKFADNDYSQATNSYTQFLCYLSNISSMDQLEYVFDKDLIEKKGQTNAEAYVKIQFQKLMQRTQEQQEIFNVIWGNTNGLPQSLFGQNININNPQDRVDAFDDFKTSVENLDNQIFRLINVK